MKDALQAVEELYRVVQDAELTAGPSMALLPLRDLCSDTLRVVTAVPGYASQSSSSSSNSGSAGTTATGAALLAPHSPSQGDEDRYASFPPHSPTGEGDGLRGGHATDERSPLKAGSGRRDSSASSSTTPVLLARKRPLPSSSSSTTASAGVAAHEAKGGGSSLLRRLGFRAPPPAVVAGSPVIVGLQDYADAPLVDIGAVFGSDTVPEGFSRVATTPYSRKADLNAGAGGHYIYLALKKDYLTRRRPPVVALAVIFPDRKEFVPPTFSVVRRKGEPVDFNAGTHGERVYLCYKRGAGNPITDIQVIFPRKKEAVPLGYTLLERTPFKYEADLNAGGASSSNTIFICYKQRLRNVDHLRQQDAAPTSLAPASAASVAAAVAASGALMSRSTSYETILSTGPVVGVGMLASGMGGTQHAQTLFGSSTTTATTALNSNQSGSGSNVEANQSTVGHIRVPPGAEVDDMRSLVSTGALNELWAHADLRPRAAPTEGQELGPFLRRTLLTPLVTALYLGHGEATAVALRELVALSTRHLGTVGGGGPTSPCPLQAFVIEALCFFVHRVQVEHFDTVVQYLRSVIQASALAEADLATETLQQMFTTCVFLCNFEAFRALENERHAAQAQPGAATAAALVPGSHVSLNLKEQPVLGVDCSAFATLRQLMEAALRRVESSAALPPVPIIKPVVVTSSPSKAEGTSSNEALVKSLVVGVVDDAIQYVELTKATQRAVDCIKRGSASSHDSFWKELLAVSALITTCPADENAFLLLVATCKLASEPPRVTAGGGRLVERDVASKLLALELLSALLKKTGDHFQQSPLFGCQVRRLVVSCLLTNIVTGLQDLRIQKRVLSLVSLLWRLYRRWCKVECGLLVETALLQTLRFPPSPALVPRQTAVVTELLHWLEVFPQCLVELYLNYDLDHKSYLSVQQPLPAFEEAVATVCGLGEDLGGHLVAHEEDLETQLLHLRTLATVAQLMRALMNASGHAHLISRDPKVRAISLNQQGGGGWEHDVMILPGQGTTTAPPPSTRPVSVPVALHSLPPPPPPSTSLALAGPPPSIVIPAAVVLEEEVDESVEMWNEGGGGEQEYLLSGTGGGRGLMSSSSSTGKRSGTAATPGGGRSSTPGASTPSGLSTRRRLLSGDGLREMTATSSPPVSASSGGAGGGVPASPRQHTQASSVRMRQELQLKQDETLTQALALYRAKGLKKTVQFLVASTFMSDTPRDVASFLRVYRDLLDPEAIGDFLGEGGNVHDAAYWNLVRLSYIRGISFHNMTLEQALRHFLTRCGFRLPGEAQKIDRLISVFAECFFQDNQGMPCCPFSQPDTPYILSYAIIILQTDLHKVGGQQRRGKINKPMSKEAFINNLRGVDESPDLTREYLSEIYDSILAHPIEMNMMMMHVGGAGAGSGHDDRARAHGDGGVPPVGGGFMSLRLPAAHDGAGNDDGSDAGVAGGRGQGHGAAGGDYGPALYYACREMAQAVRDADELLRGLAVYPNRFAFVGVNASLTPDLVKLMFESVWFHVHGLVHSVLQNPTQSDPEAILACLDIVQYALCAAMFLNLRSQRQAFATLLTKFKREQELMAFGGAAGAASFAPNGGAAMPSASSSSSSSSAAGTSGGSGSGTPSGGGGGAWGAIGQAIGQVHALVADLKDSVQQSRLREELKAVAKRIEPRAKLLEGSRRFLREGDLVKRCRSGKRKTYTFFLFSDQLLYTHRGFGGEYKVHQQMLLSLTKVSNVDDRRNCSFQIHHPKKSFVVVAESPEMKRVWMRDINEARNLCRKSVVETQLSVIARLKLESSRLMAVLEGKKGFLEEEPQPTSAPAAMSAAYGGSSRVLHSGGVSTSYSFDDRQAPRQPPASSSEQPLSVGGGNTNGRSRGGGSNASATSETPTSLRLQDVELEAQFCDGLRALQKLLRGTVGQSPAPFFPPPPKGGGVPPPALGAASGPALDDKTLATAVGLFLQYRAGDYLHHEEPPNLAALAVLGSSDDDEEAARHRKRSSGRLPSVLGLAQEAWKANAGLSQTAAMTTFLAVLEGALPGWRDGSLVLQSPSFADDSVAMSPGMAKRGSGNKKTMTPRGLARK